MKKLFLIIFTSFITALIFSNVPLALAAGKLKIYYSEPMGGQKVYHITACQKMRAHAVVKCETPSTNSAYGHQCDKENDKGKPIQGCKIPTDSRDESKGFNKIPGTTYYAVDLTNYTATNPCGGKEENIAPKYEPLWALMPADLVDDPNTADRNEVYDMSKKKGEYIGEVTEGQARPESVPDDVAFLKMYATGICATWDKLLDSRGNPTNEDDPETDPKVTTLINRLKGLDAAHGGIDLATKADAAVASGCNKTVHSSPLDPEASVTCSYVERLLGDSGSDLFGQYVSLLYKWAAGIIGIIAVLTIVFNGIKISTAGGNASAVEESRDAILKALAAVAILFLSGLILYTINPSFFVS